MEKKVLFVIVVLAALYGSVWLFNHRLPWAGIITAIVVICVTIKVVLNIIKKN